MTVRSVDEFIEDLERGRYEVAFPGPERFLIDHYRRRAGKQPLRMRAGRAVLAGEA